MNEAAKQTIQDAEALLIEYAGVAWSQHVQYVGDGNESRATFMSQKYHELHDVVQALQAIRHA